MNLYNRLKNDIEHGLMPVTIDEDGEYTIWASITAEGNIRASHNEEKIESCVDTLGTDFFSEGETKSFEEGGERFHSYYHRPIKKYEAGDLVDVLEIAKTCEEYKLWSKEKQEMVGQKGLEIKKVIDGSEGLYYSVWNSYNSGFWTFRHEYLAPHYPGTEKVTLPDAFGSLKYNWDAFDDMPEPQGIFKDMQKSIDQLTEAIKKLMK